MPARKPPAGDRPLKTLDRVLSKAGLGSRSEAREWVAQRRVRVNGRLADDVEMWIDLELDRVTFDDEPLQQRKPVYLLLHKPAGYLTTYRHPSGRATVFDLLPENAGYLFPVGRLDLDTSGLLLLTNDSAFAEFVTNPKSHVEKTYEVTAEGLLSDQQLAALESGVELADGTTRPAKVERLRDRGGNSVFLLTISEGRNRQVRRMLEAIGSRVAELSRVSIGSLLLGDLKAGEMRKLTLEELQQLGYAPKTGIESRKEDHGQRTEHQTRRSTQDVRHRRRR